MKEITVRKVCGLPVVSVVISGPKRSKRVQLVFDSGAFMSQIHTPTLSSLGFSFGPQTEIVSIKGVTGPSAKGYVAELSRFFVFEKMFRSVRVAAFDFSDWIEDGIDGLLGYDLIEQLHFEMNGPKNSIVILEAGS